jgi:integrase
MSSKKMPKESRYSFTFFNRATKSGTPVIYVRIIDKQTGQVLAQRSTGADNERDAAAFAGRLLTELPLDAMVRAREDQSAADFSETERLRDTMLSTFFTQFWAQGSSYLRAREEAGKPLSGMYITNKRSSVKRFASVYPQFQRTPLRATSLLLLEGFRDYLRNKGVPANTRNVALDSLRSPISWAQKRGLIDSPFSFSAIDRPKGTFRKRGVLSADEVGALVALPVEQVWESKEAKNVHIDAHPRPRRAKGEKNEGPALLDLRQKAALLLSELAGLRRGEIRALTWGAVDLDRGRIEVVDNYVPVDGAKKPKTGSVGAVPISEDLGPVLQELKNIAHRLKLDGPDNYVLMGARPDVPINEITIARGYRRALQAIGISDEERKRRNLVPHSGRHGFATRLADEIGERAAARLTRHRTTTAFEGYAAHTSEELLEKGRQALRLTKKPGEGMEEPADSEGK